MIGDADLKILEAWFQILAAAVSLAGAVLAVVAAVIKGVRRLHQHIQEKQTEAGLRALEVQDVAMDEMRSGSVDRVLLFAGTNCGGLPRAGAPYTASAIAMSAKNPDEVPFSDYQNLRVGGFYIGMLRQMMTDGILIVDAALLPDCDIKRYYHMERVRHSVWIFLCVVERKLYYLSASTYGDAPISGDEITRLQLKAHRIARQIRRC